MYDADRSRAMAEQLADAFLDGAWNAEALAERGAERLERWPGWIRALAFAVAALDRNPPVDQRAELVGFIEAFLHDRADGFDDWPPQTSPHAWHARLTHTTPSRHAWPVAEIDSVASLAERLELSLGQLAWLADVRGLERTVDREQLRNYRYRWVARRSGLPRLIEAPKARLKEIQRWVLHEILDHVPAHPAAHGFSPRHSVITHAAVHVEKAMVLRLDLRDFFASVSAGRVYGIFRAAGYDATIAHILTGLSTNTIPTFVWQAMRVAPQSHLVQARFWLGRQLATPHLPQGAPTSPALANLAAFALDRRLTGLTRVFDLSYSRYADDMVLSGPRLNPRANRTLLEMTRRIVTEEGFRLNDEKSTLRGAAQRQLVTGVVVNKHPNIPRADYDRLKATLHRLVLDGPGAYRPEPTVDLRAHLRGRVAWVNAVNSRRGKKLQRLLDAIDWDIPNRTEP